MIENIKNLIKNLREMDLQTIEAYKYTIIGLIVVDLFGIYWYLGVKKVGIALLFVLMGALTIFLFIEKNKMEETKMDLLGREDNETDAQEPKKEEESKEKEKDKKKKDSIDFDLGLPDAEEYQKRASEALGSF